jgi:hypothetical protein
MSDPIPRFKRDEEMTPGDFATYRRTGERPERDEYAEARAQALADAGLEAEDILDDPEDPEFHDRRKYGTESE